MLQPFLSIAQVNEKGIYIRCETKGDAAAAWAGSVDRTFEAYFREKFPCASVSSFAQVRQLLDKMKFYETNFGETVAGAEADIAKALNSRYLIAISLTDFPENQFSLNVSCIDMRKAEVPVSMGRSCARSAAALTQMVNDIGKEFSRKVKDEYEICPFTGKLLLTARSNFDTTIKLDYKVYCNGADLPYDKITKRYTTTASIWDLDKKGKTYTEGTMTFHHVKYDSVYEYNECYKCPGGKEVRRTYMDVHRSDMTGEGISHESIRDGQPQQDTRIEIVFKEDGTYLVKLWGASEKGTLDTYSYTAANSICNPVEGEPNRQKKPYTEPLFRLFGPYDGKIGDDVLKQKEKEEWISLTGEHNILTLEFEFSH
jgi:hypothetical protein